MLAPSRFTGCLLLMALSSPLPVQAWSDHGVLLWPQLARMPVLLEASLTAETLEEFVEAEATGLERLLAEHESRMRATLPAYAPRPDAIAFSADTRDRRAAFLGAIRVNPTLAYGAYRQLFAGEAAAVAVVGWNALSILPVGSDHAASVYVPLDTGERVSPAQVIASASDEPDFGIDIGLFEDNGTAFGSRYGFGPQPFGNPNLPYSSQAPFHMGFYHLDWLTRTLQPDLLRTFPAWRVSLFGALADFAFETGHGYWGWRFAGWALHYIGDLTQPYHAQPLPGVDTVEMLWLLVQGRAAEAIQLVSNRHGVLESYQFQRYSAALAGGDLEHGLLAAVARPLEVPVWDASIVVEVLTSSSVDAAAALDAALEANMPPRFVSDPGFEWHDSGEADTIVETVRRRGGEAAVAALDLALAEQLARFGRFARAWIDRSWRHYRGNVAGDGKRN